MKFHRLLHTTAIQLALRYAIVYAVLIGVSLGFLYWTNRQFIDTHIITSLEQELNDLKHLEQVQGMPELKRVIQAFSQKLYANGQFFLLLSNNGQRLAGTLKSWPPGVKIDGKVQNIWIDENLILDHSEVIDLKGGYLPVIASSFPDGERLLVGENTTKSENLQGYSIATMVLIFSVSVILALMMGLFMSRTVLTRIDTINNTARAIADGSFSSRIPISEREDEFDELAQHLNDMLTKIEQLMVSMRQVTDNVAHDLRQPLSRLRNRFEVTLLEPREQVEYQEVLNESVEDVNNILRTFKTLLEIAQTESGVHRGDWDTINLSALAANLGQLYQDQAEAQRFTLTLNIEQGMTVDGNRDLIALLLSNLLENSIKYTPHQNGCIHLSVEPDEKHIRLVIADNGPGIPANQRERVLQRFTRLESARSTPGNGLGLSLVKAVVDLHRAELYLEDNLPGLRVTILFNV